MACDNQNLPMGPMAVAIQGIITTPAVPLRRTRLPFAPTTTTATFLQLHYAPTRDQPGVDGDQLQGQSPERSARPTFDSDYAEARAASFRSSTSTEAIQVPGTGSIAREKTTIATLRHVHERASSVIQASAREHKL
jgi:hypothetical protein